MKHIFWDNSNIDVTNKKPKHPGTVIKRNIMNFAPFNLWATLPETQEKKLNVNGHGGGGVHNIICCDNQL